VIVLAHIGHWYVSLTVFLGPVAALFAWVRLAERRDKRRKRGDRSEVRRPRR
jgi:hypothetical protein